jgi:molybdopterin/thiamine biosynthesis adenylyltransferase
MLGIVAAFNFKEDSPCYECLFPRNYDLNENTCQNSGITPSVLGIIGSFMASIALKIIADNAFRSSVMRINLTDLSISQPKLKKDGSCKICGENKG